LGWRLGFGGVRAMQGGISGWGQGGISDSRGASIDLVGAHVVLSLPLHLITLGRAAGQHLEAGG
jgi:hypothetical protein